MQLYVDKHYASPYAMAVFVSLIEKELTFNMLTIDLDSGANHSPEYSQKSITRRVPTLIDGNFALSESSAICEYIEEKFPTGQKLYPTDLKLKARVRQVQAWVRSDFLPIKHERSTVVVFYHPTTATLSSEAKKSAERLIDGATKLLAHGEKYICGDEWSIADVDLALMLNRLVLNGDFVPQTLIDYVNFQWQRPSVQQWVNQQRPPL